MGYAWLIFTAIAIIVYFAITASKSKKAATPLRRPTVVSDCGYAGTGGWYDAQRQGVKNDYCRTVGDNPTWFACALAGTSIQLSPGGPGEAPLVSPADPHDPLAPGDVCYRR